VDLPVFDEMRNADGSIRIPYQVFEEFLSSFSADQLHQKRAEADHFFRRMGITFLVYFDGGSSERLIPFDILPRILDQKEWRHLESGCVQRVRALNMFLDDIYQAREIFKAGVVPEELILENAAYRPEAHGISLPFGVYAHVAGIDVVRVSEKEFYVLEDNLRTPSGVSYMLENREVMMRLFPEAFAQQAIAPVDNYCDKLLASLRSVAPKGSDNPTVVLLTPGRFNSAYFEHVFLAEQMGIELVEGQDLFVDGPAVYMRTTEGPQRIDVIYRRIDDEFLDPLAFLPDSALGVPGVLSVVRAGGVTLANAIGSGVADDKAIYTYVPDIIRFYLSEDPILSNVPTYRLRDKADLQYTLEHLDKLVVKEVHGSGGYGMLIGPKSTKEEIAAYRERILADPAGFIAQPTLALSSCPTLVEEGVAPRHVDLRPFILSGSKTVLIPGAFTRVALREGSLVVNSSQGGGTKDTWVLQE
jgi:uncharacterized circularly permuted ATP-grasp superfamily protein